MDWIEVTTLGDTLLRTAERHPERTALVFPDARLTYAELADRALHAARGLAALGVGPGDHVGLLLPNGPEFVAALYGTALLGAVVVPINTRFGTDELAYVVRDADLTVVVTAAPADRLVAAIPPLGDATDPTALALPEFPRLRAVIQADGGATIARLAASVPADRVLTARERVSVGDVAMIPYTSGTTSRPKGCRLTHEALTRNWRAAGQRLAVRTEDVFWVPCPMFHAAGYGPLIFCAQHAATYVSDPHFAPDRALDTIEAERVTFLYPAFPAIALAVLTRPDFGARDLSAVRGMLNVAPRAALERMQAALPGAVQVSGYGMTEGTGIMAYNDLDDDLESRVTTTGRPFPGIEFRVVDPDTGRAVGAGTPGELWFRGFNAFRGYHNDPARTREVVDADGWVRTGDLGALDERGRIVYIGRIKDTLKVGGENVAPAEVESLLATHPDVVLAAVVGLPDDRYGEVPAAFVELRPGSRLTDADLVAFCTGRIARYKVPRVVRFVTEWPMSATKIQKDRLRAELTEVDR